MSVIFRTTDLLQWGAGKGSNLTAEEIDGNFWELLSRLTDIENDPASGTGIDYFVVAGDQLTVHLTDHSIIGPYTLPTAQFTNRGAWAAGITYSAWDILTNAGSLYLCTYPHTAAATFDPNANDGVGNDYYSLLLESPDRYQYLALYAAGAPIADEILLRYVAGNSFYLPDGLEGSNGSSETPASSYVTYSIQKNGVDIASVIFGGPSPETVDFLLSSAVHFVPGDVLSIVAPTIPNASHADFSITLKITLE